MGGEMPWTILLFASGSLAIPAPSIFLVPPYPSSQEDPIYISCTAPEDFLGANFTLFRGEEVVQLLQAPSHQPGVTFNVTAGGSGEGGKAPGGNFHCQYSVIGEHSQPQLSDLSQPVQVSFPVPTWILALSLSLAGAVILLAGLVAVAVVVRKVKARNLQKQRERESCWAQINFTNTDMSFDNSLFAISTIKKMTQEDLVATLDAHPCNSGPRKRPTSASSSPEPPEFSTFRACQ
ncbi:protein HIDE1 isoform X1 [Psammomys obesus]|uniref:protein HIDE1 isoform X1 n=1 Tax=Psammomys obesus TaxID=48139 RepID=UPI002452B9D4|nr:protein HIDE1 isoform X1 [Psammomys obesus]XP_055457164.1 protein HIDE1 isoform X1 [Psammomys obesus]XP_055457165.1 protein HIDE1 isoform X1 [Psammomys obesus]XP_055457166.1 protein HIDE1 isoform X1 [Psammomys obesus]XP_055457167.1 protein HIDE1 isoform X1 [Psammomys obesus]XP_055457168.1 protein HIDE1 isoform X1 [Psammomys obesus]XP_055457169.1 protein HIDE1 isoform X1 [Psammomys obesus]